ncbi:MAG: sugar phosphate isomerase/epimerase family protein [Butyricicoccus sp.]
MELCEQYGFDYIDLQESCLNPDLEAGKCTLEELGEWFRTHRLKMYSYNALEDFNMRTTPVEQENVMAHLHEIIRRCNILGCKMIVLCPSRDLSVPATIPEIRENTVQVLRQMLSQVEPYGIKLSLEFCGFPTMSINRFQDAYAIVQEIDSPLLGITMDQAHFHSMASDWDTLWNADGRRIFTWHLNDLEDVPCGASYNDVTKRLFPGDPRGCMDHARYVNTLKHIGYNSVCSLEVFRPEYYALSQEENVRAAAACIKKHFALYDLKG